MVVVPLISTLGGAIILQREFKETVVSVHFAQEEVHVRVQSPLGFRKLFNPIAQAFMAVCENKILPDVFQNEINLRIVPNLQEMPDSAFPILMRGEVAANFPVQLALQAGIFTQTALQKLPEHMVITINPRAQLLQKQT